MRQKRAYIVEGWNGETQIFYGRSLALQEYFRRMNCADGWELICENNYRIEHRFYDGLEKVYNHIIFQEIKIKIREK